VAYGGAGPRLRDRTGDNGDRDRQHAHGFDRSHARRRRRIDLSGLLLDAAGDIPRGAAAAAGIALVNSVGNIAGFASTYVVGWLADLTHSNVASLYLFGALLLAGAGLILMIPASVANK